ncbi:DUF3068 domain-containing protein [Nocardioides yefusunii]|uniref:DUF3068 domain-containing protein n=1 Tax=Nocardioides yefusunii TaxID=2500546 RepID=A0ABW1QZI4_9ACTN|nr:DUF3068 domain-containing protein [Nocardioides yefusunii]
MRKILGPILSGIGGFLLVLGLLLNVYAYPRLAVAPLDQDVISVLDGPGARFFDVSVEGGKIVGEVDTDFTITAKVVGDVDAAESHGDNVAVWTNSTKITTAEGKSPQSTVERVAFDRTSGEAVDCCDAFSEKVQGEQNPTKFQGQVFKFPFQTKQQEYLWWDSTLEQAFPAKFVREEEFHGMNTYVFEQKIEPRVTGQQDVSPDMVGEIGTGSLKADRTYSNQRTFWVEPETGVVMDRVEKQYATLRFEGEDRAVVTDVEARFSKETVDANVSEYGDKVGQLKLIRFTLPLVLGVLGAGLLVAGLVLGRRSGGDPEHYQMKSRAAA